MVLHHILYHSFTDGVCKADKNLNRTKEKYNFWRCSSWNCSMDDADMCSYVKYSGFVPFSTTLHFWISWVGCNCIYHRRIRLLFTRNSWSNSFSICNSFMFIAMGSEKRFFFQTNVKTAPDYASLPVGLQSPSNSTILLLKRFIDL